MTQHIASDEVSIPGQALVDMTESVYSKASEKFERHFFEIHSLIRNKFGAQWIGRL